MEERREEQKVTDGLAALAVASGVGGDAIPAGSAAERATVDNKSRSGGANVIPGYRWHWGEQRRVAGGTAAHSGHDEGGGRRRGREGDESRGEQLKTIF